MMDGFVLEKFLFVNLHDCQAQTIDDDRCGDGWDTFIVTLDGPKSFIMHV